MIINRDILTLEEFRKQELRFLPNATGELSNLLRDIALAAKRVNVEVNKAGLVDILGETGAVNIQGESVQRLDEFANTEFTAVLQRGVSCAGIASEELDEFVAFNEELCNQSKYVVVMDPLDGSSNIDSDELLYYVDGDFMSRKQVSRGMITLHPAGIPHGPHPGMVEKSLGAKETKELAVMLDSFHPLMLTRAALEIENKDYINSWK